MKQMNRAEGADIPLQEYRVWETVHAPVMDE